MSFSFYLCLSVLIVAVASQGTSCNTGGNRIDCKQYTQSQCVAEGCCWSPVNPNPNNEPWCFYQNSGSAVCNADVSIPRIDCGYAGITQQECQQQLCCWSEVNPNPNNLPWCFQSNPIAQGYQVTQVTTTSTGFLYTLSVLDPQNQFQYGTPISPLAVQVDFDTPTRLHVKIYDPNNERWEIPTSVINRSRPTQAASNPLYTFSYTQSPFGFAVTRNLDNQVLFNTSIPSGVSNMNGLLFKDQFLSLTTQLPSNSNIYGLQESSQSNGFKLTPRTFTLWNRDTPSADDDINLYGSQPFYLQILPNGNANGVLLLNSNGMDVIYSSNSLQFNSIGGVLDFYFFVGPSGDEVVQQYSSFIGLPHMQPYWSFGFHQSRYGMPNIDYVEQVVANYSAANIPLDTIWSDIDYMDVYKDFTWDPVNYPLSQVQSFTDQLHSNHQQYVVIVDPGIKNDTSYFSFNQLIQSGGFVRDVNGNPFIGQVWPGYTIFPDFLNPSGQSYWLNQFQQFLSQVPYDGIWIDMNEISNFCTGECTNGAPVPPSSTTCGCSSSTSFFIENGIPYFFRNENEEKHFHKFLNKTKENEEEETGAAAAATSFDPVNPPYAINNDDSHDPLNTKTLDMNAYHFNNTLEYNSHNLYSLTEAIQTRTSLESIYSKRSFVLSRSTFPSSGQWTAHWTGDNASQWPDLYWSVVGLLNFNILGLPMIGSDICGFLDDTTEELCSRWIEVGAFYPFSRNHNTINAAPQELYRWPQVASISSFILSVRYSLLPLYYTLNYQASTIGSAIIRPLFFQFPTDSNTFSIDRQFLVGSNVMVIPVLDEGATSVQAYFPSGVYYEYYTFNQFISSGGSAGYQTLDAPLNFIPLYLLGGSITPRNSIPELTTLETRTSPFNLTVAFDGNFQAKGELFVDDGTTLNYSTNSTYTLFQASIINGNGNFTSTVQYDNYEGTTINTYIYSIYFLGVQSMPSMVYVNSVPTSSFYYGDLVLFVDNLYPIQVGTDFTITWNP